MSCSKRSSLSHSESFILDISVEMWTGKLSFSFVYYPLKEHEHSFYRGWLPVCRWTFWFPSLNLLPFESRFQEVFVISVPLIIPIVKAGWPIYCEVISPQLIGHFRKTGSFMIRFLQTKWNTKQNYFWLTSELISFS